MSHDDLEEIRKLKARYFRYLDTKDWEGYCGVFAEDCVVDLRRAGGSIYNGIEEFGAYARSMTIVQSVHHGHMPEIDLTSPTTATGVWSMEDYNIWEDNTQNHGWGHYLETYEKRDERWYIKTMKLSYLRVEQSFGTAPMIAGAEKRQHLRGTHPAAAD
jgi:ketosteroid isomerase-like protein